MRASRTIPAIVLILFASLITLFAAEMMARRDPAREADRSYRSAHCFDRWLLVLCPDVHSTFLRPDGSPWELNTNEFAERITPSTLTGKRSNGERRKEVWFIGDSISMGYLLDDQNSPPWVFEETSGRPTRNLGSDSLGTAGIRRRLDKALADHKGEAIVQHLIWIYNTSDFTDDPKEERLKNNLPFRMAYRLHYALSRTSSLYLFLRRGRPDSNVLPPGFEAAPPKDHPTWQALRDFRDSLKKINMPLTILVYPGYDPRVKGPGTNDPTTAALLHFLAAEGIDFRDLSASFEEAFREGKRVYVPGDGHPDVDTPWIFATHAMESVRSAQN